MPEAAIKPKRPRNTMPSVPKPPASSAEACQEMESVPGTLTFVTADGERLVFSDMDLPLGELVPVAGEEALGKIWNRPAEDAAYFWLSHSGSPILALPAGSRLV